VFVRLPNQLPFSWKIASLTGQKLWYFSSSMDTLSLTEDPNIAAKSNSVALVILEKTDLTPFQDCIHTLIQRNYDTCIRQLASSGMVFDQTHLDLAWNSSSSQISRALIENGVKFDATFLTKALEAKRRDSAEAIKVEFDSPIMPLTELLMQACRTFWLSEVTWHWSKSVLCS